MGAFKAWLAGSAFFYGAMMGNMQEAWSQAASAPVNASKAADSDSSAGPESGTAGMLGEIIVTAQKRSERLQDVPMSVNAATGQQLETLGITSTEQLERAVPGFSAEKTVYGLPVYYIRGVGFNDTTLGVSPAVSVYTDQFALPFSAMARGAILDLERVEVLKGPQGTLFGQNSTGGAINYIAAKPTRSFESGFDLTYGRFNEADAEAFVSGPISSTVSARLAIRNEYRGDWQKGYTIGETSGATQFHNARLIVDWAPLDTVKVEVMATGWTDDSDTQQQQFLQYYPLVPVADGGRPVNVPIASFPTAPNDPRAAAFDPGGDFRQHNHFYQLGARGDIELSDRMTLTSLTSYESYKLNSPADQDGTIYPLEVTTDLGTISSFSQELRLNGTAGDRIKWMAGGNFERDTVDERLTFDPTSASGEQLGPYSWNAFRIDNNQNIKTKSGFGSLDFGITDTLTAQGSARFTDQDRGFAGCTGDTGNGQMATAFSFLSTLLTASPQTIPPGGCVTLSSTGAPLPIVTGELNQSNVSWRGSLNWKVTSETLLYANVTKGYKSGSFPTLPAATAIQYVPVTQESLLAYETGVKLDAFSRMLQFDGALFYYDYSDKQLVGYRVLPPFGAIPSLVTIPKAKIEGAELSLSLHPTSELTITANGTYIDTRINSNPSNPTGPFGNSATFIGQRFPYTPTWQGVFDAQYRFAVPGSLFAYFGAGVSSRSATSGALLSGAPQVATEEALLKIPGYSLLDLRAGLEPVNGPWRLELWGRNVANRFYVTGATHNSDYVSRFSGMPATFGFTVKYRFE
jgi:iron complex outermembrane recepter protein